MVIGALALVDDSIAVGCSSVGFSTYPPRCAMKSCVTGTDSRLASDEVLRCTH